MALIATQFVGDSGLTPTFAAAASGDTVVPTDRTRLEFRNASASPITVTLECATPCSYGSTAHDRQVTVPAISGSIPGEATMRTGPATRFAGANGQAAITYSATANLTRAAVSD